MLVTNIRRIDDKRFCLYVDYEPFGPVYQSDIKRLGIKQGEEISFDTLADFRKNCLYKRAMNKAVSSVKYSEKCEYDIRKKLEDLFFDAEIIDYVVCRLKEYSYIDDKRYASAYVRTHIHNKSRNTIAYMLSSKKIPTEIIDEAFEINSLPDEEDIVRRLILKQCKNSDLSEKRDKIIISLLRKGYSYNVIQKCISTINDSADYYM